MTRLEASRTTARTPLPDRPPSSRERSFPAALRQARGAERARPGGRAEERPAQAAASPPPPWPSKEGPGPGACVPAASLRAVARAAPVDVALLGARDGDGLALEMGRSLSVELRGSRCGIEVTVRPAPALARVAAAELTALVRALRQRGVTVARAEVMPPRVART